jgi:DNA modification methylase
MLEINKLYCQDCLIGMNNIDDKSIDCIICDLQTNDKKA